MSSDERFFARPWSSHPIDATRVMLYIKRPPTVVSTNSSLILVLQLCRGARTRREHSARISAALNVPAESVNLALDELVAYGALQPIEGYATSPAAESAGRLNTVGMVTADRPHMVRRALADIVAHTHIFGRPSMIIVVDGSRSPINEAATRQIVQALDGVRTMFVGASERRRLIDGLIASGFDRRVVLHALQGGTAGAGRNILMLLLAGDRMLMVDDDIRWQVWRSRDYDPALALGGHASPYRTEFYESRADAIGAVGFHDTDLLSLHDGLLGRTSHDLLQSEHDLSQACGHMLVSISEGCRAQVNVTMMGVAGDDGAGCSYRLLFSTGRLRAALVGNPTLCHSALEGHERVRSVRQPVVTHDPHCMAGCAGIDCSRALAPFLPAGRNEDAVFGAVAAIAAPDVWFGHLPWGIVHDSDRPPRRVSERILSATQVELNEIVLSLAERAVASSLTVGTRLRTLCSFLKEIGTVSIEEFRSVAADLIIRKREQAMSRLMMSLEEEPAWPAHWTEAVERFRAQLWSSAAEDEFFCPIEFRNDSQNGMRQTQLFIREFGEAINVWAEIWRHARDNGRESLVRARS